MKIATLTVCMGGDSSSEGQLFSEKPFKTPAWLASAPQPLVDMDLGKEDCVLWVVVGELVNLVNLHSLTATKMRTVMLWIVGVLIICINSWKSISPSPLVSTIFIRSLAIKSCPFASEGSLHSNAFQTSHQQDLH